MSIKRKKSDAVKVVKDPALIRKTLSRSISAVYPTTETFEKKLLSGNRLRFYLGIDPTSPHLHLGHAVSLWVLRRFQDFGHEIILLVGDFTARIGDPTDKSSPRQPLTEAEVQKNLKTFKKQAAKIIKFDGTNPARLEFNSRWYNKMTFKEIIALAHHFTVQQMIERDMFQERMKNKKPIGLHEFLYPLMQGYDSVAMDVDVEVGGTDQIFNMLAGRTLMKVLKHKEKFVIANKLLVSAESGKKLSKTEGNLINLDEAPREMFGKTMAIPDEMILSIAELSTDMPMEKVQVLAKIKNPRDAKLSLAETLVAIYHSPSAAKKAKEEFINTFSKREMPTDMPTVTLAQKKMRLVDFLLKAGVSSKSEARRLIQQGAIQVNQETVSSDDEMIFAPGDIVKIGKKRFLKIK